MSLEIKSHVSEVCESTWNSCYPDRRPWAELEESARAEWRHVIAEALTVHTHLLVKHQESPFGRAWLDANIEQRSGKNEAKRVGCAACDRGDFQLGHHHECPVIKERSLPLARGKGEA